MAMNYKQEKPEIRLLQSGDKDFFLDCVDELYEAIETQSPKFQVSRQVVNHGRLKSWLVRKLSGISFLHQLPTRIGNSGRINFAAMISGDFRLFIPAAFFSRNNYIYMYDAWPRFHRWIFPLLNFFNINCVFFSSKQVYEAFVQKYPERTSKAMWLPEALTIAEYCSVPHAQREIDVLEFGRNYAAYHELITAPLLINHKIHIYKSSTTPVLFPGKAAFTTALSQSRIVICVPSNISHPERAEYLSTMTLRYLQAMASKCLIVGMMPSDMEELFGYVPIVEIDMNHAAEQILEVLDQYEQYLPLIEKNYALVKAKHQWQNRWEVIQQKMEEQL